MDVAKAHILSRLKKEILPLNGFKRLVTDNDISIGCNSIEQSFPNASFPIGCMHEFVSNTKSELAATNGFIISILGKLMALGGACIHVSTTPNLFPASFQNFGINPEQIIFIHLKKERDVLYATEEALKCNKVTAVITDAKNISFKESRRFQLASEESRATGFLIRHQLKSINTIACVSRWRITSLPSLLEDGLPGVGFPRWNVELLKVRNGTPGKWNIEWRVHTFKEVQETRIVLPQTAIRKAV